MTRWHPEDLAGMLLRSSVEDSGADQWTILHLPAISDDGVPLWSERYSKGELDKIKATIGSWEFGSLYQGDPQPPQGAIFDPAWFKDTVQKAPDGICWARYWDLAVSTKTTADYTASVAVGFDDDGNMYIRDMVRDRWSWHDARRKITEVIVREEEWFEPQREKRAKRIAEIRHWNSKEHHKPRRVPPSLIFRHGVEQDIAGRILFQELMAEPELRSVRVEPVPIKGDKLTNALPWSARAEQGRVFLVDGGWTGGAWIPDFLNECRQFSGDGLTHDDQIDAVSGGVRMMAESGQIEIAPNPFYG